MVCLGRPYHITSNFLNAVFHKFYLVHSSILCPVCPICERLFPPIHKKSSGLFLYIKFYILNLNVLQKQFCWSSYRISYFFLLLASLTLKSFWWVASTLWKQFMMLPSQNLLVQIQQWKGLEKVVKYIEMPEWCQWRRSGVFIVTLTIFHTFF